MRKNNIIVAMALAIVSANGFAAEWKIGNETYPNKAAATKAAREMALERANELFRNPTNGVLVLEKGKTSYIAIHADDERAKDFRCQKRNGDPLQFEGKNICVLTLRQYANKIVYPSIVPEKQGRDEGGFRLAGKN